MVIFVFMVLLYFREIFIINYEVKLKLLKLIEIILTDDVKFKLHDEICKKLSVLLCDMMRLNYTLTLE